MIFLIFVVSQTVGNFGVIGAAWSSIGTGIVVLTFSSIALWKKLRFCRSDVTSNYDFGWFTRWTKVGAFSALDSFIRNAVYLIFILRAMNMLEEQARLIF